jgi:hypothetical protein
VTIPESAYRNDPRRFSILWKFINLIVTFGPESRNLHMIRCISGPKYLACRIYFLRKFIYTSRCFNSPPITLRLVSR